MTLEELIAQRDELDRRIEQMRTEQRQAVIEEIRAKVKAYGLTLNELEGRKRGPRSDKGVKRGPRPTFKEAHAEASKRTKRA